MIGRLNVNKGGGGDVVNGIIEQYLAETETIEANTFVEFVNSISNGTPTSLSNSYFSYYELCAVALSDDKIFIAYSFSSAAITGAYLHATICTINQNNIEVGIDTRLCVNKSSGRTISSVALSDSKVFIAHKHELTNNDATFGMICNIINDTITVSEEKSLGMAFLQDTISTLLLSENRVFVVINAGANSYYLLAIICTIVNNTIQTGVVTELSTITDSGYKLSTTLLVDNKIFMAYYVPSWSLYGELCTISDTTITVSALNEINGFNSPKTDMISCINLSEHDVFIAKRMKDSNDDSKGYLYGMLCTISDTDISSGTFTKLSNINSTIGVNSILLLSKNKLFIVYNEGSQNYGIYGMTCTVSGTYITVNSNVLLASSSMRTVSALLLSINKIFIAYANSRAYALLSEVSSAIKEATSKINGITKSKATTTSPGDVWVLNN